MFWNKKTRHKRSCFLLSAFCFLLFWSSVHAECNSTQDAGFDQYSNGQYSYECNVKNLCLGNRYGGDYWNFDTSKQLIIEHNMGKYPDLGKLASPGFTGIREIYQKTQNEIMNCAILKSKYTLHKKIIDSYNISSRAKKYLEKANAAIEKQFEQYKCIAPREGDKIYNFKDLLDSMSYEQCGYSMYLWYFDQAAKKNLTLLTPKKSYSASEWAEISRTQQSTLTAEYWLSRKAMVTALSMYENFEKTYVAHVFLEMIEVELTEDKRFMGTMTKAIQQLVSVMKNAQKSPNTR